MNRNISLIRMLSTIIFVQIISNILLLFYGLSYQFFQAFLTIITAETRTKLEFLGALLSRLWVFYGNLVPCQNA